MITTGSGIALFDQDLIEKVLGQVKEDSFISSSLSLAKLACFQLQVRGKSSTPPGAVGSSRAAGQSGYSSSLDYSRSGSASSSGRGGSGKLFKGGRGAALSPKPK